MKKVADEIRTTLVDSNIDFKEYHHKPVRTSEEADAVRPEYSLSQGAKALIVRVKFTEKRRQYIMFVIPGDKRMNSKKVKKGLNCKSLTFATFAEVEKVTGGVQPGGVPPFGNLFSIKVYVDPSLSDNDEIIFNAGDRSYSIAMRYDDWEKLIKPSILDIIE